MEKTGYKTSNETVHQNALKCKTRNEFRENYPSSYKLARKRKILEQVCSHMELQHKYWTNEEIQAVALKYETRSAFALKCKGAYDAARRRDILEQVCSHMKVLRGIKTDEQIHQEALKYQTRYEFQKKDVNTYQVARKKGMDFLNKICSHMQPVPENWTDEEIQEEALKCKSRGEFQKKFNATYNAAFRRGMDYLNKVCAHMEPPLRERTDEEIWQDASKCTTRKEFREKYSGSYQAASKRGMLDEVCAHMEWAYKYRTDEEVFQDALKCQTRTEFAKKYGNSYSTAFRRNIIDKACAHMELCYKIKTDEEIHGDALKCETRTEFRLNYPTSYKWAHRRGLIDEFCSHIKLAGGTSIREQFLFDLIKERYPKAQKLRDRKVKIPGKPYIAGFDIDIYIPELRKGIEFDGGYWHSAEGLRRSRIHWAEEDIQNYHKLKDEHFLSKGIALLHVKEEDWKKNPQKCIEECFNFLGE